MYIILYYIPCACFRRRPRNRPQRSFGQIVVFTMTFPAISKTKNHRRGNIISYYCFYIVAQKRYIPLYIFPASPPLHRNSIIRAISELFEIVAKSLRR